jgi:NAD(P)-dependent dehydrogenase (short-subunit alcohol dehydrogenase family)
MTSESFELDDASAVHGQVALVTGANRGIGRAIAEALSELGMTVLIGARRLDEGQAVAGELSSGGDRAEAIALDISDDRSVADAAETIRSQYGRLDVLVNNAAIKLEYHPAPPSAASLSDVIATLDTNVVGTIRVIEAMLPLLRESPRPRIVNMSSGLGSLTWNSTVGSRYQERPLLGYSTSKAAINMLTVLFANELRDTPMRVNAVDPGPVNTPMTQGKATRQPDDGARPVVRAVMMHNDGPTGCFFDERGVVPW